MDFFRVGIFWDLRQVCTENSQQTYVRSPNLITHLIRSVTKLITIDIET